MYSLCCLIFTNISSNRTREDQILTILREAEKSIDIFAIATETDLAVILVSDLLWETQKWILLQRVASGDGGPSLCKYWPQKKCTCSFMEQLASSK